MEITREIYWNIGHGWKTLVPMYLLTLVAIGVLVLSGLQRLKIYRLGKPIHRTEHLWERLIEATATVLGQTKVVRVRWPGLGHGAFSVANCPFCLTMFEDGVKGAGVEDSLRPRDIAEILAERILQPNAQK